MGDKFPEPYNSGKIYSSNNITTEQIYFNKSPPRGISTFLDTQLTLTTGWFSSQPNVSSQALGTW